MNITFDTDVFANASSIRHRRSVNHLIWVLRILAEKGQHTPGHYPDIERLMTVPSVALKYVKWVTREKGMSPEGETVFLKNPVIALDYLRYMGRPEFLDPKVQKRFHRKLVRNPQLAVDFCKTFKTRLTEKEEEVFVKDMGAMRDYSVNVIKGMFPQKVHEMILLRSFGDMPGTYDRERNHQKRCLQEYIQWAKDVESVRSAVKN